MNWNLVIIGIIVSVCLVLGISALDKSDRPFDLTLLHTNDVHSHFEPSQPWNEPLQGGAARIATLVREIREEEPNVLFLDAGDPSQGTLYYNVGGPSGVAQVMSALGYDAMCIGNHEFDAGPLGLACLIDEAAFPVLSANVNATAEVALVGRILPFDVFLIGDEAIAVFGLTTESTVHASNPGPNVQFQSAFDAAAATVATLDRQGIDKIIALTHLGYDRDLELAAAVSGIDVIVGGHSHTLLGPESQLAGPYPTMVRSPNGEPVVVVTAYEWGRELGRLDIVFDRHGVISEARGELIPVGESVAEAPDVVALLAPYADRIGELMTEPVGSSTVALDGDRDAVRSRETNLGDLIADAMLWKTGTLDAQAAIQNGGGIRASIPAGEVTMGQVLEVLPFGNEISTVTLTGEALVAAIENGVSQVEAGAGRFPQVAGIHFSYDLSAEPGARIRSIDVWNPEARDYQPAAAGDTYVVAVNSFLADGGDGYDALTTATARYDTGWLLSDVLAEYLEAVSPISAAMEGRIRMDGENEEPPTLDTD